MKRPPRRRRRSDWLHEGNDDPLVRLAAESVTKALDRRWRSMVTTSAIVGVLASLATSLPIVLIQDHQTNHAAAQAAQHNCRLITQVASIMGSGDRRDPRLHNGGFLSSDAALRATEASRAAKIRGAGPLAQLLTDPATVKLERANAATESATLRYWRQDLIPALLDAAHVDCDR